MPVRIVRNDITLMDVDAIVNSTNSSLFPGGTGVDATIHYKAGPELTAALKKTGDCGIGDTVVTDGYKLKCRHIIHTVGPIWLDGLTGETEILAQCYRNVLKAAYVNGCSSIATPIISAGAYGFPKRLALETAMSEIKMFLEHHEMEIYIVVYDREMVEISEELYSGVERFIRDQYIVKSKETVGRYMEEEMMALPCSCKEDTAIPTPDIAENNPRMLAPKASKKEKVFLPDFSLKIAREKIKLDEGFGEAVIRLKEEKNIKSAELCLRANITKAVLSNITQSVPGGSKYGYKPKKTTALAIGIAFRLNMDEMNELLKKAGYVLSRSELSDVIIEYFIQERRYDIYEINEVLFSYDQQLLGSV